MEYQKYQLTNPQKSIYLTEKFYNGTSINNICGTCIIHSELNFELLQQAIKTLIANNDNFKIHFQSKNNIIQQFISQTTMPEIEIININELSEVEKIEKTMQEKVYNIFSNENLYDFKIYKLPNNHGGFILNIHHLLADSWTLGLVARTVMQNYNGLLNGGTPSPEKNKFSYLSYIEDENTYLNSEKFVKDNEYWNSIFDTVPNLASIPTKNNVITNKTDCCALRNTYTISKEKMDEISSFCKNNNISVFNFFMSIYSIYIGKVCNTEDFVIGTPILNRSNFAQKQTHGMFISTLPVRINLNLDNSFVNFSKEIATNSLSMLRHQKYPYQNILENLRKKQPDLPNLYNILLSYQITKTNTDGFNYETRWAFNNNCADDMQIHILDLNDFGSVNIFYDYKTQKFNTTEIDNIHNRILHIIEQVLNNNSIKLSKIEIITQDEKAIILKQFNNTKFKYNENTTLIDLFEEACNSSPSKTAIICNGEKLTFDELNKKANQLANHLLKNNVSQNDLVGFMTTRSLEMAIGLLAILKIGAAYVPIDPSFPEERVLYIIENSKATTLLVDNTTFNNVENTYKINISLDNNFYNIENSTNLNTNILPDSLMYLIYTSGSTGKPKGVMLTHKNVHNFLNGINNIIDFKNYNNILSLTTISFDIFVLELWGGLINGLTVIIATENEQKNSQLLNKLCIENHVEMLQTTPSRMSFFIKDTKNLEFLKNISVVMLGGEGLPPKLVENIFENSNTKLYNMYGPTETTVWSTIQEITSTKNISIGKPISNTTCYVLNDTLNLLPPYTPGLLYIGGDGVSKGYFNKPELTLEKFITSPFIRNELIYNTGDLAYYDENGNLYHLGRNDFQIKLRGYRIELGEIENKILSFPGIKETCVIADKNYLICYYTTHESSKVKESNLTTFLLSNLPDYMVPSEYIKLEEMPLTPNGKLDRKNLPKIEKSKILEELPTSETEKLLTNIISKILNKEIININESFMAIGLDSLGIIQAQTELLSYEINLTTHHFYKYPSIKKLAQQIDVNYSNYSEEHSEIPDKFKHYPDEILSKISTIDVTQNTLGNVFLTGANGFIGIHILNELLHTTQNNIYCLVRGESNSYRVNKLKTCYEYYFNEDISQYINTRIFVIGGDISFENLNMNSNDLELFKNTINTVINTAAIVKHYGDIKDFETNNIQGTKNIVNLAYENNLRLIHLSSISVSGNYLVKQDNHDIDFSENDLYIGQHYEDNNYVYSKMECEKLILKYMEKGLIAQIHRVGIVSGRYSDGFFQKKINENAFYSRIKSIIDMNAISDTMTLQQIEFTPVDLCAKAIVALAKNSVTNNKVFNIYNHNLITVFKILEVLKHFDINIDILNSKDFNNYILNLSKTKKNSIKGIINDLNYDENNLLTINYNFTVNIKSKYTTNYLHLLNFDWPVLEDEYIFKILKHMKDVNFI